MEHRNDWERILLDGLPEQERRHVERVMAKATAQKLARLRASQEQPDEDADPGSDTATVTGH